jgi:hypothetical protein
MIIIMIIMIIIIIIIIIKGWAWICNLLFGLTDYKTYRRWSAKFGSEVKEVYIINKIDRVADFYNECDFPEGTSNYEQFHEQFIAEYQEYEKQDDYWYTWYKFLHI